MYEPIHTHRTEYVFKILPLVCRGQFSILLHRFSPQFVYISLIVSLPYSIIRGAHFLLFLLCSSHYYYFVRNVCKSVVFINIPTVMNSPLVPLGGLSYSPV